MAERIYIIYYNFIIITISFLFSFQQGRFAFENSIFRNGTAHHIFHSGNLIHHFCHDLFNNRTESAAPVFLSIAFFAMARTAFSSKTSSTLSMPRSF